MMYSLAYMTVGLVRHSDARSAKSGIFILIVLTYNTQLQVYIYAY